MFDDLASALLSLAVALVTALPLGRALKKNPMPFYAVACVVTAAYLGLRFSGTAMPQIQILVDMIGKGYLACMFFAVVMFTGTFDLSSAARKRLQPIRAELSIISFILILGHAVAYLASYLPRLGVVLTQRGSLVASFVVAVLLLVIFALLGVTSLHVLRARIPRPIWKRIQRLSYAMVALLYVHVLLVLGRSAFVGHGSGSAAVAIAVYTVLTALYAALRIRKALRDRAVYAKGGASSDVLATPVQTL